MDRSPVPFPSLLHQAEESQNMDSRPAIPSRVHSSPSLPNLWLPAHNGPLPHHLAPRHQVRYRPHLRPLDLASSPTSSPTKLRGPYATPVKAEPSRSPSRVPSMLTPPLTPSSSFNSNTHEAPSTPPEAISPLRWIHHAVDSFSDTTLVADADYSPTSLKGNRSLPQAGYLTPSSGRTHSISSDGEPSYSPGLSGQSDAADLASALAAGISDLDLTPRDERKLALSPEHALDAVNDLRVTETTPSRFLMVKNVPPSTSFATLRMAFSSMGDIKGIFVRFQVSHSVILLAFFDVREATRAKSQISGQTLPGLEDVCLEAGFVTGEQLDILTGRSPFVTEMDAAIYVTVEDCVLDAASLRNVLASFGELLSFEAVGADPHDQTFHVEYYDVRTTASVFKQLNNRTILNARLRLFRKDTDRYQSADDSLLAAGSSHQPAMFSLNGTTQQETERSLQGRVRPRSVSASETMGAPDAVYRSWKGRESPTEHGRRPSNDLFFDAIGKTCALPETSSRPRSISIGTDNMVRSTRTLGGYNASSPAYHYSEHPYSHSSASAPLYAAPSYAYSQSMYAPEVRMYGSMDADVAASSHWAFAAPPAPTIEYYLPPSPRVAAYQPYPSTPRKAVHPGHQRQYQQQVYPGQSDFDGISAYGATSDLHSFHSYTASALDFSERDMQGQLGAAMQQGNDKNQLNIAAIEEGKDMRTTVMVKNIPNKMSDKDLMAFINKVCPRRIDFLYLRMDFQNGCNVGYAFVNFITIGDLLHFAKTQLGVKWNMYSSEKVLQMCYATYQGKEAAVEKFKNSCIMDERESWRPKIFYSDGPNQGLPEPFPPPTHLRRKERSSHNRGALFVPGAHHVQGQGPRRDGGSTLYHHHAPPPRMSTR
ncbi:RNA recognition motif 2-domain-containing protein [Sparassis latifolia]